MQIVTLQFYGIVVWFNVGNDAHAQSASQALSRARNESVSAVERNGAVRSRTNIRLSSL